MEQTIAVNCDVSRAHASLVALCNNSGVLNSVVPQLAKGPN